MAHKSLRSRGWCFTDFDLRTRGTSFFEDLGADYVVIGLETCPKTGKFHRQGYVYWNNARAFSSVRKKIPGAHIEAAKGSASENRTYCTKEKLLLEIGTLPSQGNRSDLKEASKALATTKIRDFALNEPEMYCRYRNGLKDIRAFHLAQKFDTEVRDVKVIALLGPAGAGKTRAVYDTFGFDNVYTVSQPNETLWFDHYDGEEVLLLDDFYGGIKYGFFLQLLDIYPLRLPTKGGHTYAGWNKIVITSNKGPHQWYNVGLTPALERRIHATHIVCGHFDTEVLRGNTVPGAVDRECEIEALNGE